MGKFASDYFILRGDAIKGPTTADRLRALAANGKLLKTDGIRRGEEGGWIPAGEIDGLFEGHVDGELLKDPFARMAEGAANAAGKAAGTAVALLGGAARGIASLRGSKAPAVAEGSNEIATPSKPEPPPLVIPQRPVVIETPRATDVDACPFCHETIKAGAKKCRHCGEILDVVLRAAQQSSAGQPSIQIVNNNSATATATAAIVGGRPYKRWSRLVAMFLSFLFPGLGQLYKGQVVWAVFWFFLVGAGYYALIIPGLVLHFLCVCSAGMGDPYR